MSCPDPLYDYEDFDMDYDSNYDDHDDFYDGVDGDDRTNDYWSGDDDLNNDYMDGDHDSGMASAGWGTDEDYGYYDDPENYNDYGYEDDWGDEE